MWLEWNHSMRGRSQCSHSRCACAGVAISRQNFVDSNRVLAGSLEKLAAGANYRDGATVEAFTWSLIPTSALTRCNPSRRTMSSPSSSG